MKNFIFAALALVTNFAYAETACTNTTLKFCIGEEVLIEGKVKTIVSFSGLDSAKTSDGKIFGGISTNGYRFRKIAPGYCTPTNPRVCIGEKVFSTYTKKMMDIASISDEGANFAFWDNNNDIIGIIFKDSHDSNIKKLTSSNFDPKSQPNLLSFSLDSLPNNLKETSKVLYPAIAPIFVSLADKIEKEKDSNSNIMTLMIAANFVNHVVSESATKDLQPIYNAAIKELEKSGWKSTQGFIIDPKLQMTPQTSSIAITALKEAASFMTKASSSKLAKNNASKMMAELAKIEALNNVKKYTALISFVTDHQHDFDDLITDVHYSAVGNMALDVMTWVKAQEE